MSQSRNSLFAPVLLVLVILGMTGQRIPAQPSPEPIPVLVSGDASGLRKSRSPFFPRGGSQGLARALSRLDPNSRGLRLLVGNNLGRAVRAGNEEPPEFDLEASLEPSLDPRGMLRLSSLLSEFPEGSPARSVCEEDVQLAAAGSVELRSRAVEEAFERCENLLLLLELTECSTAVALGEGDFNHFRSGDSLRVLRYHPFLSNNLFVSKASSNPSRSNGVEIAFADDAEQLLLPYSPIVLTFDTAPAAGEVKRIRLISTQVAGSDPAGMESGWQVEFQFPEKVILYRRSRGIAPGERVYRFPLSEVFVAVDAEAGTIRLRSPVPLLAGSTFELEIDRDSAPMAELRFATFETFTRTDEGLTGTRRGPVLRDSRQGVHERWVGGRVPVIRPEGFERDVRVLSFLDDASRKRLDRFPCTDDPESASGICEIEFGGVQDSALYWGALLGWLEGLESLDRLETWALDGFEEGKSPSELYGEIKALRKVNALPGPEDEAWRTIETWSTDCRGAGYVKNCPRPLTIDLRVESIARAMKSLQRPPGLVLLLQMKPKEAGELLAQLPPLFARSVWPAAEILLAVAAASPDVDLSPLALSQAGQGLLIVPQEEAQSIRVAELEVTSDGPRRLLAARVRTEPVPGFPPQILHDAQVSGSRLCCSPEFRSRLNRLLSPETGLAPFAADREHFLKALLQQMRTDADSETAFLETGFFDLSPLEWLRVIRVIADDEFQDKYRIRLDAGIEELSRLPGIGDLARAIRTKSIRTLAELEDFLESKGRAEAYRWARWFFKDCADCLTNPPWLDESEVLRLARERFVFVRDELIKVTTTAGQLQKVVALKDIKLRQIGIETKKQDKKEKHFLHGLELKGEAPVVSAFPSRLAQADGVLSEFGKAHVQKDTRSDGSGNLTLESVFRNLVDVETEGPLKEVVASYDRSPWWNVSLKKMDLDWQKLSATDDFKAVSGEPRTESRDETRLALKPELEVGYFLPPGSFFRNWSLDWKTSFSLRYAFNRIRPRTVEGSSEKVIGDVFRNPLEDEWKLRSQADLFFWKRLMGAYLATEYVGQFQDRFQAFSIAGTMPLQQFAISKVQKREFNHEVGLILADAARTREFSVGLAYRQDLSRLARMRLFSTEGDAVDLTPAEVDAIQETIKAKLEQGIQFQNDGGLLQGELEVGRFHQWGLAMSGKYGRDLYSWNDGQKKISFSTELKDADFYFRRDNQNLTQPQMRILWETKVSIPLIGNIRLAPALEAFFYRIHRTDMPDPVPDEMSGSDPAGGTGMKTQRFFQRWIPSVKFTYTFDAKPGFQRFWRRALWFHNKGN